MMNKYQEALDDIEEIYYNLDNCFSAMEHFKECTDKLRLIVNKQTPKKIQSIRIDNHIVSVCPSCQSILYSECFYCPECGQELDYGV